MILAASCGTEDKAEWGSAQSGVHAGLSSPDSFLQPSFSM
jgi:hypothetical protein